AVIVKARGISTSAETVAVVPVDPGLFQPGQDLIAAAGSTLTVTATGLGPKGPDGKAPVPVTAQFDGADSPVQSAIASDDSSGVYTLKITVPPAAGQHQLTITASGVVSNAIPVTVQ